jgi:hypothetical protein
MSTKEFNVIIYLEKLQKKVVDNIIRLSEDGTEKDAVKLKANTTLLNKLVPDRTKLDVDIRSQAPYDKIMEQIEKAKPKPSHAFFEEKKG